MTKNSHQTDSPDTAVLYQEALDYLYGLINFEMRRHDRYMANKLDSSRPQRLMSFLGDPHRQFPAIHIAGTKGKGSVAAMCAACLRAAGLRVGLYTSPHVQEFRERIRILTPADADGRISEAEFVDLVQEMKTAVAAVEGLTWFEVVTGIAFRHFAVQEVDVAVVEVGLGGRLDATNVLTPLVSVITSLSYDHTEFLGDTLAEIAMEKGGIIKPGIPVVTADQEAEALERLQAIATERDAPLAIVGREWQYKGRRRIMVGGKKNGQMLTVTRSPSPFIPVGAVFDLALAGAHQFENATVTLGALSRVQPRFPSLTLATIQQGLATVSWIGRLQIVHQSPDTPTILADCAHNTDSAAKLRHALRHDYNFDRLWLVFGATEGKDIDGMLDELLPLASGAIGAISSHPRAVLPEEITRLAADLGYQIDTGDSIEAAVIQAWEWASPADLICVTGSIFVVGDLLNQWESLQSQLLRDDIAMQADARVGNDNWLNGTTT